MKSLYKKLLLLTMCFALTNTVQAQQNARRSNAPARKTTAVKPKVVSSPAKAIDLGLPSGTLWASCNVGATKPEEYGDYFAWGETKGYNSGKRDFSWRTYKWCAGKSSTFTKYCNDRSCGNKGFTDNKKELDLEDDAAYVNWGSQWRMPSLDQIKELKEKCTWIWTQLNGVNGYRVTSKTNGNSIFLPATGWYRNMSLDDAGSYGYYRSRSLSNDPDYACGLEFGSGGVDRGGYFRSFAQSVRPVRR